MYVCRCPFASSQIPQGGLCYTDRVSLVAAEMDSLTLTLPDDWHIHLRDGPALSTTVPDIARWARRAIVMPNLTPPVLNAADATAYRNRILVEVPAGIDFEPLMTLYLTDDTTPSMIAEAAACPSEPPLIALARRKRRPRCASATTAPLTTTRWWI